MTDADVFFFRRAGGIVRGERALGNVLFKAAESSAGTRPAARHKDHASLLHSAETPSVTDADVFFFRIACSRTLLLYRAAQGTFLRRMPQRTLLFSGARDNIVYAHVSEVRLSCEGELPWSLDGEYGGDMPQAQIHIRKQAADYVKRSLEHLHVLPCPPDFSRPEPVPRPPDFLPMPALPVRPLTPVLSPPAAVLRLPFSQMPTPALPVCLRPPALFRPPALHSRTCRLPVHVSQFPAPRRFPLHPPKQAFL